MRQPRDEVVRARELGGVAGRARRRPMDRRGGCCRRPVPRNSVGCCGTSAVSLRQRRGIDARRGRRRRPRIRPDVGSARRRSSETSVLFPTPLGPTIADVSPGADHEVEAAQHVDVAARVGERDALERDRRERRIRRAARRRRRRSARVGEVEQPLRDGGAVGARVELRSEVAERQVELRCEDENGERGLEADASLGQPHADDDGDERDPQRRRQLEDRAGEERDAERSHRRPAVLLAHLGDPRSLRVRAVEGAQRRQAAHDVQEVVREERQRLPALPCAPLGVAPDEPHEDRDERKRQQHHAGGEEVDRRDKREHGDGNDECQDDLREVARERRLERLDAGDRSGRDLGALRAVERRGRDAAASSRRRRAEAARSRRRPLASRRPRSPTPRASARPTTPTSSASGVVTLLEGRALERARRHTREQNRLCEHEQRHDDTEHRVGDEQQHAPPAHGGRDADRGAACAAYADAADSPVSRRESIQPQAGTREHDAPARRRTPPSRAAASSAVTASTSLLAWWFICAPHFGQVIVGRVNSSLRSSRSRDRSAGSPPSRAARRGTCRSRGTSRRRGSRSRRNAAARS